MTRTFNSKYATLLIAFLIVSIGMVTLVGCNQDKPKEQAPQVKAPEIVKIGAILPLTGPVSIYGQSEQRGMTLAVEELNSRRGETDPKFELRFEDSQAQPKEGVSAANKLLDVEGVNFIFTSLTGVSRSVTPIIANRNAIQVVFAMDEKIPADTDNVFRIYPGVREQGEMLVKYARMVKPQHVGFIYFNRVVFESLVKEALTPELQKLGTKTFTSESFDQADNLALRSIAVKLKEAKPDLLYVAAYYNQMPSIFKAFGETGLIGKMKIAGILDISVAYGSGDIPAELLEDVVVAVPAYSLYSEAPDQLTGPAKSFVDKHQAKYQKMPIYDTAFAYDATRILADAVMKVGPDAVKIRSELIKVTDYEGAGGRISILPDGNAKTPWELGVYHGGKMIPVEVERSSNSSRVGQ
jgi:branched-chain amino acid transport system substrate-binding protein